MWINLTKDVRDLYSENSNTQMKEVEDNTDKWENIPCPWIWTNIIKNVHTTQSNLQIQYNPYQNIKGIFHRTRTNNPKICTEPQKITNSQSNHKKEQSWRYQAHWFQTILQIPWPEEPGGLPSKGSQRTGHNLHD